MNEDDRRYPAAPEPPAHAADEPVHPGEETAPPGAIPPPPAQPVPPPRTRWYRRRPSVRGIGGFLRRNLTWLLFGLALIAAGVFAFLWMQEVKEDDALEEVERSAEAFVLALTNFSSDSIEADVAKIKSFAVGDFAEEANVFFGNRALAAIQEAQASTQGEIDSLFVQSFEDDQATVFAVVTETVDNADLAEPRTDILRMSIDMVKLESGWKVTNVDVLQSPGSTVPVGA